MPTQIKTLYDQDFALWIETTVNQLKTGELQKIDVENLIEEIESLGKRDKRELENRLTTLFEHALKRCFVNLPECYRGWEISINRTQQKLSRILRDSPSLKNYLLEVYPICYQDAFHNVSKEYDAKFPDVSPFTKDVEDLLIRPFAKVVLTPPYPPLVRGGKILIFSVISPPRPRGGRGGFLRFCKRSTIKLWEIK